MSDAKQILNITFFAILVYGLSKTINSYPARLAKKFLTKCPGCGLCGEILSGMISSH